MDAGWDTINFDGVTLARGYDVENDLKKEEKSEWVKIVTLAETIKIKKSSEFQDNEYWKITQFVWRAS